MQIKDFLGTIVLDKNAYEVGKVSNVEFDPANGKMDEITLTLQKNLFSKYELVISFDDIATIGAYVILNKEIPKEEVEEVDAETVEVEIDDE